MQYFCGALFSSPRCKIFYGKAINLRKQELVMKGRETLNDVMTLIMREKKLLTWTSGAATFFRSLKGFDSRRSCAGRCWFYFKPLVYFEQCSHKGSEGMVPFLELGAGAAKGKRVSQHQQK